LEKYSLLNFARKLFIDREYFGGYEGRWLRIRSHHVNGPAFGGLAGNAGGFGKFLRDQLQPHSRLLTDSTRALLYAPATDRERGTRAHDSGLARKEC
jgi:hypothetical protein